MPASIECLIEAGARRAFAAAADWPGWCRAARDEDLALQALVDYGPRYEAVMRPARLRFAAPTRLDAYVVSERVPGNATTDFGAPDGVFEADSSPPSARAPRVLRACWDAFDRAAEAAEGVELRKGPRGGGRALDAIVAHVVGAEASYLRRLTAEGIGVDDADPWGAREPLRTVVLAGLQRAEAGELPTIGPRGGALWTAPRFLRRTAWHVLDHAWEIEDRSIEAGG